MADDTRLNLGAGGDLIATDDIAGTKFQRVKLIHGADGVNDGDVATANPLPADVREVAGAAVTAGAGNVAAGSQRVVIATDDVNLAAIKTAVEIIDNPVSGSEMLIAGGATQTNDLKVTLDGEVVPVSDNGGSLTVDAPVATPVNVQLSDGTDTATINTDGSLDTKIKTVGSIVDSGNSSVATLGIGATFTGASRDLLGFSSVACNVVADQDGAALGLQFQFSSDGSNWDDVFSFDFKASVPRRFQFPVTAQFFRVVFVNGGTGQGLFRLQTILHTANVRTTMRRLDDNETADRSSQITKAVLIAQADATGDFIPVSTTPGGNLKVSVEELNGVAPTLGAGAVDAGTQRVTVATDDVVSVDDNAGSLTVDAPLATPVNVQIGDGTDTVGVTAAGDLQVDLQTALPAGSNNIGDVDVANVVPVTATGTITALNGTVQIDVGGYGAVGIQLSGTWAATVEFQASVDGTNWSALQVVPVGSGTAVTTSTANGIWYADVGGLNLIRCEATAFTSGTVQVDLQSNVASGKSAAGGGSGGTSLADDSAFTVGATQLTPVGGTFRSVRDLVDDNDAGAFAMTQRRALFTSVETPLGQSAMDDTADAVKSMPVDAAGAIVGTSGNPLRVDPTGTTAQPVSDNAGSLTVDAPVGTPLNAQLSDGVQTAGITAAGSLDVNIAESAASVTVAQPTHDNLQCNANVQVADADAGRTNPVPVQKTDGVNFEEVLLDLDSGAGNEWRPGVNLRKITAAGSVELGTSADPVRVDPTGTTIQPVSGTVTANAGTGNQGVNLTQIAGNAVAAGSGIDGTGVQRVVLPSDVALPAGDNNIGNVDIVTLPDEGQQVMASSISVAVASDQSAIEVVGDAASDAPVAGNPLLMGGRASDLEPTAVSLDGDAVAVWLDRLGRVVTVGGHPPQLASATHGPKTLNVTASGDTALVAAPGASLSIYVTGFWLSNNAATKIKALLRDGTTARYGGTLAADGGGVTRNNISPPWKLAANAALNVNLPSTGDVEASVEFFVAA